MAPLSIPTTSRLPPSLRLDVKNSIVQRTLSRLSRSALLSLALDWLDENNQALAAPYLSRNADDDDDGDDFYPPADSLHELRERYTDLQARKGSKREILDQILLGDWRRGVSLYQLAMADLQYLHDHPSSQKWTAYRIQPLKADDADEQKVDRESLAVPRFHPSTFLRKLQAQIPPDVKAHYNFERHRTLPLLLLRVFVLDSPYNTSLAASTSSSSSAAAESSSRTVYLAFPDASPHVFVSASQTVGAPAPAAQAGEARSLRALVVDAVPKALSRPRERYALRPTNLATRNLAELLARRGAGRGNAAAAGWGVYADDRKKESPLDTVLPTPPLSDGDKGDSSGDGAARKRALSPGTESDMREYKRAKRVAEARFGDSGLVGDGKGVERLDIVMEDPFPRISDAPSAEDEDDEVAQQRSMAVVGGGRRSNVEELLEKERLLAEDELGELPEVDDGQGWRPTVRLTFHGVHVFAGMRQLVENGIVDGERMPGWMTGEEGVTIGAVRHGRIRGHKGSGL